MLLLLSATFATTFAAGGAVDCSALAEQEADRAMDFRLATVTRPNVRLVSDVGSKIQSTITKSGDPLIVSYPPKSGYVLAIIPKDGVLSTGCVSAGSIRIHADNRSPPTDGWIGKWRKYQSKQRDYDTIAMAPKAGKVHVTGTSFYFYNPREADAYEIDASARPKGDILEVDGSFEMEDSGCTIRIQRLDPYIVVTERAAKEACSPNNATFAGVYHRLPK